MSYYSPPFILFLSFALLFTSARGAPILLFVDDEDRSIHFSSPTNFGRSLVQTTPLGATFIHSNACAGPLARYIHLDRTLNPTRLNTQVDSVKWPNDSNLAYIWIMFVDSLFEELLRILAGSSIPDKTFSVTASSSPACVSAPSNTGPTTRPFSPSTAPPVTTVHSSSLPLPSPTLMSNGNLGSHTSPGILPTTSASDSPSRPSTSTSFPTSTSFTGSSETTTSMASLPSRTQSFPGTSQSSPVASSNGLSSFSSSPSAATPTAKHSLSASFHSPHRISTSNLSVIILISVFAIFALIFGGIALWSRLTCAGRTSPGLLRLGRWHEHLRKPVFSSLDGRNFSTLRRSMVLAVTVTQELFRDYASSVGRGSVHSDLRAAPNFTYAGPFHVDRPVLLPHTTELERGRVDATQSHRDSTRLSFSLPSERRIGSS